MIGILGKKIGMSQLYSKDGKHIPVTLVEVEPSEILNLRTNEINGYTAVQLGIGSRKKPSKNKPKRSYIREVRIGDTAQFKTGDFIHADVFREGSFVDITGVSKGKGFQGGMKRWHWRGGPSGHGSMQHRQVGSVGASSFPSRIHKGKTMPGHMGHEKKTIQNIEVLKVDKDNNLLVVKGSVPGPNHSYIVIREAKKLKNSAPKLEAPQGTVKKEEKKKDKR